MPQKEYPQNKQGAFSVLPPPSCTVAPYVSATWRVTGQLR